eukprot:2168073-Rhodomonas_salina.1
MGNAKIPVVDQRSVSSRGEAVCVLDIGPKAVRRRHADQDLQNFLFQPQSSFVARCSIAPQ